MICERRGGRAAGVGTVVVGQEGRGEQGDGNKIIRVLCPLEGRDVAGQGVARQGVEHHCAGLDSRRWKKVSGEAPLMDRC